jgi:hypothetical protein
LRETDRVGQGHEVDGRHGRVLGISARCLDPDITPEVFADRFATAQTLPAFPTRQVKSGDDPIAHVPSVDARPQRSYLAGDLVPEYQRNRRIRTLACPDGEIELIDRTRPNPK